VPQVVAVRVGATRSHPLVPCGCLSKLASAQKNCFPIFFATFATHKNKNLGQDSQNFLGKFVRVFVTLGLKILRFFRLKVLFEGDIIKG